MPGQSQSSTTRAFADAVSAAREQAGLTADAVAARAGIDASAYRAIESGERQVDLEVITRLAEALGLSAAALLQRAGL